MTDEQILLHKFVAGMRSEFGERAEPVARGQCGSETGSAAASWRRILAFLEGIEVG